MINIKFRNKGHLDTQVSVGLERKYAYRILEWVYTLDRDALKDRMTAGLYLVNIDRRDRK